MKFLKLNKIVVFFFIIGLLQIYYHFAKRSSFNFDILKNPLKKDAHINYVLEKSVIEANQIIKEVKLKKFNLSKKLNNKNEYFYQRTIEYSYPIKYDPNAEYTLFLSKENKSNCESILKKTLIELKKCQKN